MKGTGYSQDTMGYYGRSGPSRQSVTHGPINQLFDELNWFFATSQVAWMIVTFLPRFFCICTYSLRMIRRIFSNTFFPELTGSRHLIKYTGQANIPVHIMVVEEPVVPGYYRSHVTVCKIACCSEILVLSRLIKP